MMQGRYRWVVAVLAAAAVLVGAGVVVRAASRSAEQVSVLASWTGAEEAAFRRVLDRFTEEYGIDVAYQGTRALSQVLLASFRDGSGPDLAVLPNPGELAGYARQGVLHPLDAVPGVSAEATGPRWLRLETGGGEQVYAVAIKADLKGLIWYRDQGLVGPEPPRSWDELRALGDSVPDGETALWCMGMASTPASGWPGTDWIENILLRRSGPEVYERWAAGELPWTSPEVTGGWEDWRELLSSGVHGGSLSAVLTEFTDAGRPMFTDQPGCYLDQQASFTAGIYEGYEGNPRRGTDFHFFPFPPVTAEETPGSTPAVVSADLVGMFSDTPQSRQLVEFLISDQAQRVWAGEGQGAVFSLRDGVDPNAYPDGVDSEIAELLATTPLCFDASDLMPATMANAFHHAILEYLYYPERLSAILENLESVRLSIDDDQWLEIPCGRS